MTTNPLAAHDDPTPSDPDRVRAHYGRPELASDLRAAIRGAGLGLDALERDDLHYLDAFHVRGRSGTDALLKLVRPDRGLRVLDIGSGIGGTARHLAATYEADVTGVDLTPEYCEVATELSARTGFSDSTRFVEGSALALPFADASFDLVWTEHVQMNVADKARFYAEARRVLRPGGQLAFHDVFSGPGGEAHFPVPWAGHRNISHLARPEEVQRLLGELGLTVREWHDTTPATIDSFEEVFERTRREGMRALGLHHLIGPEAPLRFMNLLRSLHEARVTVIQAVWDAD